MSSIEAPSSLRIPETTNNMVSLEALEQRNALAFEAAERLVIPFATDEKQVTPWAVIEPPRKEYDVFVAGHVWLNLEDQTAHVETLALINGINSPEEIEATGKLTQDLRNLVTPDQTHTHTFNTEQLLAVHANRLTPLFRRRHMAKKITEKTVQLERFERDILRVESALSAAGYLDSSKEAA